MIALLRFLGVDRFHVDLPPFPRHPDPIKSGHDTEGGCRLSIMLEHMI